MDKFLSVRSERLEKRVWSDIFFLRDQIGKTTTVVRNRIHVFERVHSLVFDRVREKTLYHIEIRSLVD